MIALSQIFSASFALPFVYIVGDGDKKPYRKSAEMVKKVVGIVGRRRFKKAFRIFTSRKEAVSFLNKEAENE